MPIDTHAYKPTGLAGCKWDRRSRTALFDVVNGRQRIRRVFSFESVEKAKAAFPDFKAKVKAGAFSDDAEAPGTTEPHPKTPTGITVAEYVSTHWDSLHSRCGDSTKQTNSTSYKNHVQPFFGERTVTEITEADCEDFAAHMKAKGKSPYTANLALRFLRKVLHHARRRKVRSDVPENFHFAKEPVLKLEMNDSEQARFFAAFDDEEGFRDYLRKTHRRGKVVKSARFGFKERRFGGGLKPESEAAAIYFQRFKQSKLIFTAAVDLGYRETDLRLLKRTDVDLRKGIVSITTQKTDKTATVALSDRCREAIVTAMFNQVASTEYVFCTEDGKPYSESTLRRYYDIAKGLAGITRRCRLNDLRHTFASNLADEGLSLLDIRDALGHTTVRMSERYAKPNAHAIERMRQALNARQKRVSKDNERETQATNE